MHDLSDRTKRIPVIVVIKKMGDNLCICIGNELIPFICQLFLQFQIVFYDTVMHDGNAAILVQMGMRVNI